MGNTRKVVRGILLDAANEDETGFDANDEIFEAMIGLAMFAQQDSILVTEGGFERMASAAWKAAKTGRK